MIKDLQERIEKEISKILLDVFYNKLCNKIEIPQYDEEGKKVGSIPGNDGPFSVWRVYRKFPIDEDEFSAQDIVSAVTLASYNPEVLKAVWEQTAPGWYHEVDYNEEKQLLIVSFSYSRDEHVRFCKEKNLWEMYKYTELEKWQRFYENYLKRI